MSSMRGLRNCSISPCLARSSPVRTKLKGRTCEHGGVDQLIHCLHAHHSIQIDAAMLDARWREIIQSLLDPKQQTSNLCLRYYFFTRPPSPQFLPQWTRKILILRLNRQEILIQCDFVIMHFCWVYWVVLRFKEESDLRLASYSLSWSIGMESFASVREIMAYVIPFC